MAYCKNCINAVESNLPEGGLYCMMFRSLCGDTIGCSNGVDGKRKAKTNADRIRTMTDEELEVWLVNLCCASVGDAANARVQIIRGNLLNWLKQEVNE